MSRLILSLSGYVQGQMDSPSVNASIYDVMNQEQFKEDVQITLNYPSEIDIIPGKYIIEIVLPSGNVMKQQVSLYSDDETKELVFKLPQTPNEWLGWQTLLGHVKVKDTSSVPLVSAQVEFEHLLMDGRILREIRNQGSQHGYRFDQYDPNMGMNYAWLKSLNQIQSQSYHPSYHNVYDNYEMLEFVGTDVDFRDEYFNRQFLYIHGHEIHPQVCVLPIPWYPHELNNSTTVEVLVKTGLPMKQENIDPEISQKSDFHRLSIAIQDDKFSPLLGYLGLGYLDSAQKLINRDRLLAMDFLYGKKLNPLAAAAGSYVLLDIDIKKKIKSREWIKWIENLMNWFPWMPDGAIQFAWALLLKTQMSNKDKKIVRENLLKAVSRGIPYFSKGVSLLYDGLRLFSGSAKTKGIDDSAIEESLKLVESFALRTNMRQPFTSILL